MATPAWLCRLVCRQRWFVSLDTLENSLFVRTSSAVMATAYPSSYNASTNCRLSPENKQFLNVLRVDDAAISFSIPSLVTSAFAVIPLRALRPAPSTGKSMMGVR